MKTYVVHWKQLPERRTHILENFQDLDLEFVDKYDKTEMPFDEMNKWFSPRTFEINHTPAAHCVAMSIISILEKIKTQNACILEDDACPLVPNYKQRIDEAIESAPPGWDILFISDSRCGSDLRSFTRGVYGKEWLLVKEMRSTCAWIVSPKGAQTLLEMCRKYGGLGEYKDSYFDNWMSRVMNGAAGPVPDLQIWWSICPFVANGDQIGKFKRSY